MRSPAERPGRGVDGAAVAAVAAVVAGDRDRLPGIVEARPHVGVRGRERLDGVLAR